MDDRNMGHLNLLRDVVEYIKDEGYQLKRKQGTSLTDKDIGRQMALYSLICMIREEALAFGMKLDEIGLANYDPDRDML
jgi:hypothetical protein